ncbi:T9SS type A sorting domain-containing protein [bacterium]|nr:T9SS type A sorting domain-containing protein [bacterium]
MKTIGKMFFPVALGMFAVSSAFASYKMEKLADRIVLTKTESGNKGTENVINSGNPTTPTLLNTPGNFLGSSPVQGAASPFGITVVNDTIWVANHKKASGNLTIKKYRINPTGVPLLQLAGTLNVNAAEIDSISGIAYDGNGNLLMMKGFNFAVGTSISIQFISNPRIFVYNLATSTVTSTITPNLTGLGTGSGLVGFNGVSYNPAGNGGAGSFWTKEIASSKFVEYSLAGAQINVAGYFSDDFAGGFGFDATNGTLHDVGGNQAGFAANDIFVLDNTATFLGGNTPLFGEYSNASLTGRFFNNVVRKNVTITSGTYDAYFALAFNTDFVGATIFAFEGASASLQPDVELDGEIGTEFIENPLLGGTEVDYLIHDFGDVTMGSTGTYDLVVSNKGQATLAIDSVVVMTASGNPTLFSLGTNLNGTIVAPGSSATTQVNFVPTTQNPPGTPFFAFLRVYTNDENPSKQALFYGNGVSVTQPVGGFAACLPVAGAVDQVELKWSVPGVALSDTMRYDDNDTDGGVGAGASTIELANKFTNNTGSTIYVTSASFLVNNATNVVGLASNVVLYPWNSFSNTPGTSPILGGSGTQVNITNANLGQFITFNFPLAVEVISGASFVASAKVTAIAASTFPIGIDDFGATVPATLHWARVNSGTWSDISTIAAIATDIPMVRANYTLVECIAGPVPGSSSVGNNDNLYLTPVNDVASVISAQLINKATKKVAVSSKSGNQVFDTNALLSFKLHSSNVATFTPNANNIVAGAEALPYVTGQDVYSFIDTNPDQNFPSSTGGVKTVYYKIIAVYNEGPSDPKSANVSVTVTDLNENTNVAPTDFELVGNYPNPFNPTTKIEFTVKTAQNAELSVYNVNGQLVKTLVSGKVEAGTQNVVWDATDFAGNRVASGIYFSKLSTENGSQTKKMLLLK